HRCPGLLWIAFAMNKSAAPSMDRRPITTRNRKWAQTATTWLASRNVSPNAISIAGMCACIAAGLALSLTSVAYHGVSGVIAAILAIFTAYVRAAGKIAGAHNEFCGPMAKQHRMLVVTVACLYSAVVPRSWQIFRFDNVELGVMGVALFLIIGGCLITVGRR